MSAARPRRHRTGSAAQLIALGGLALAPWLTAWARADACAISPGAGPSAITVRSAALGRAVRLYFPADHHAQDPLALIIELHGTGGNGAQQSALSGLRSQADRRHFLLASPDGGVALAGHPGAHAWNVPGVPLFGDAAMPPGTPDDVQFLTDLIDALDAAHCIDTHRIYVTGFSGGARMASALACRMADRLAAVAPVSGLRAGLPRAGDAAEIDAASCAPTRPVPILAFHGTGDPTNPYAGSDTRYWGYSVPKALARWAELDGCKPVPRQQALAAHIRRIGYRDCREGSEVALVLTEADAARGGGHRWPRPAGENPLDASALIVDFFLAHRRD